MSRIYNDEIIGSPDEAYECVDCGHLFSEWGDVNERGLCEDCEDRAHVASATPRQRFCEADAEAREMDKPKPTKDETLADEMTTYDRVEKPKKQDENPDDYPDGYVEPNEER